MDISSVLKNLHPLEIKVITSLCDEKVLSHALLEEKLDFKEGHANQVFSWLRMKGLIEEKDRVRHVFYEATQIGLLFAKKSIPEIRFLCFVKTSKNKMKIQELASKLNISTKDAGSAYSILSKDGAVKMDEDKNVIYVREPVTNRLELTAKLLKMALNQKEHILRFDELSDEEKDVMPFIAKKRGASDVLFKIIERDEIFYEWQPLVLDVRQALNDAGITGDELGQLTPEMLKKGEWKEKRFRAYNIDLPPARIIIGRSNPYVDFLDNVKDKLLAMGFEEFDGPLVESDFWNSDALFMPQFHAARDIHDVYYIKKPQHVPSIEEPYLNNVANIHKDGGNTGSRGWEYNFDKDFTRRLILRSHGTVLSAKQLKDLKIPGKYFGIVRCFRSDKVDATHLSDFYQTEGIVAGDEVNLKTLLGILKIFATEIAGASDVRYVPGYFPFTEPSIEVHIKHPKIGWFELGGAGIMRPEVTESMGVKVPTLAWGIGIDRMALMALKLNDIRELFASDIEKIRQRK